MSTPSDDPQAPSSPMPRAADPAATTLPPAGADAMTLLPSQPAGAGAAATPLPSVPGYEILGELGRGGMGAVFRGRDPELGRELAVKVLLERHHDDPRTVERFLEEAQVGGQLQHPGVVPVYEAGRLPDDRPYFTMKLVEGRTLAALLNERDTPARDLPRFLLIFQQICQTLAYAHSKGILHRDLKPANAMVGAFGELQVMDWGLAKVMRSGGVRTVRSETAEAQSEVGSVMGSPAYMAPEQACGDVEGLDERCDVFGLGAILCEVLTGSPPYRGRETGELLRKAARADLGDAFARLDGCGAEAELAQLAKTCLAAEPAERPRDAGAVAAAMTAYLAGVQERLRKAELERAAAHARAEEAQAKTRAERRARRMTAALAATVLVAVTGAGAGALWYQHDQSLRAAEHTRRAANTERDVTAALEEATALGKQAATLKEDPAKWGAALTVALSAVKRAEGVLSSGESGDDLRGRVAALRAELEAADKDRRMIAALEAARFQEAAAGKDQPFDHAGAAALYAQAFHDDDLDVGSLDPAETAARINRRVIRDDLLAAVANWANITANKRDQEKLRGVLLEADRDPDAFRNRWNAAVGKKDVDALRVLATNSEAMNQPMVRLVTFGRTLSDLGAAPEAVKFLKAANERHPGDFWINFELGWASAQTKPAATDEEILFFTVALALRPQCSAAHNDLGIALRDKGKLDEAIAEYRKALQIQPDFANPHDGLGNALRAKGQVDEAIAEFRKALQIQPDFADAHNNLGNALQDKSQLDQAIAEFRKALQILPDFAAAHNNLGIALRDKGKLDEAIAEYHKALQILPDFAAAHNNLGNALRQKGQLDQAIAEYDLALQIQPDLAEPHSGLGLALQQKGQLDEAIAEYHLALQIQPDNAEAHINLGAALGGKQQWGEAITESRKAIQIQPDNATAHINLGTALYHEHQADEAIAEFRKAIALKPDMVEAHNHLGAALDAKGRVDEAITEYRKALQIQPTAAAHNGLAMILENKGQLDEAIAEYRKSLQIQPAAAGVHYNLGLALYAKHQWDEAITEYRTALEIQPDLTGAAYNAACAAALAGRGQGGNAPALDDTERTSWRKKALDWLRIGLALWIKKINDGNPEDRAVAAKELKQLQEDTDLAGVRDKDALAKLPAEEQDVWRKLWADVDALLKKAQDK